MSGAAFAEISVLHAFKVHALDVEGGIPEIITLLTRPGPERWRARVLTARPQGRGRVDTVDGVEVRRVTSFGSMLSMPIAPSYVPRLWAQGREADIVHFHAPFPLADTGLAAFPGRRPRLVVHWHSDIIAQKRTRRLVDPLRRACLARADRIIVAHEGLIETSPLLRENRHKCVAIPFGIDTAFWATLEPGEIEAVERLRAASPRLIVAVGRLVPYKGFDVLVEAMREVDARLVIIGTGVLEDDLRRRIASSSLGDRVSLAGRLDPREIRRHYHAASLVAMPSTGDNEVFGLVQVEAMAAGRPMVNTALGTAVPWVARNGRESLTVPPGDAAALAAAMRRILKDEDLAGALGAAARQRALSEFDVALFRRRVDALYREILGVDDLPAAL